MRRESEAWADLGGRPPDRGDVVDLAAARARRRPELRTHAPLPRATPTATGRAAIADARAAIAAARARKGADRAS